MKYVVFFLRKYSEHTHIKNKKLRKLKKELE